MIDIHELVRDADLDWHAGWTLDEDAENRYATLYRLIREAVVQELVAGSGEPVAWAMKDAAGNVVDTITEDDRQRSMSRWADCYPHPLLLRDQLAGAVARERERCAKVCEHIGQYDESVDEYYSDVYATAIRSGE